MSWWRNISRSSKPPPPPRLRRPPRLSRLSAWKPQELRNSASRSKSWRQKNQHPHFYPKKKSRLEKKWAAKFFERQSFFFLAVRRSSRKCLRRLQLEGCQASPKVLNSFPQSRTAEQERSRRELIWPRVESLVRVRLSAFSRASEVAWRRKMQLREFK